MNVDFSRVKKSPVPASAEPGTLAWYRGDGIKIGVYADGIRVYDKDDNLLAAVDTTTSTPTTAEVKDAARKALDNKHRAENPPFTEVGHTTDPAPALDRTGLPVRNLAVEQYGTPGSGASASSLRPAVRMSPTHRAGHVSANPLAFLLSGRAR